MIDIKATEVCTEPGCEEKPTWLIGNLPILTEPFERWNVLMCDFHGRQIEHEIVEGYINGANAGPYWAILIESEIEIDRADGIVAAYTDDGELIALCEDDQ